MMWQHIAIRRYFYERIPSVIFKKSVYVFLRETISELSRYEYNRRIITPNEYIEFENEYQFIRELSTYIGFVIRDVNVSWNWNEKFSRIFTVIESIYTYLYTTSTHKHTHTINSDLGVWVMCMFVCLSYSSRERCFKIISTFPRTI